MSITANWKVIDSPVTRRRRPEVQEVFDFLKSLPAGKGVLIPAEHASTARNAASQLKKESEGAHAVRFYDEANGVRAVKVAAPVEAVDPE